MILIDLSQIAISNAMKSPDILKGDVQDDLIKHMIINSIRLYKRKFHKDFGQVVICCDSNHYWRRDIFPYYKEHRKHQRKASNIDWKGIFTVIRQVKEDLKNYFPYKVIEVHGAEGDDIIGILARDAKEATIIIGSDKDYGQLHANPFVSQYSPTTKKFIKIDNPKEHLNSLIISGDKDDGIPNIKSDSDTFVKEGKRQSPIRKTDLGRWKSLEPKRFCESRTMLENYKRNKELIDFNYIPEEIVENVHEIYSEPEINDKQRLLKYFANNRMKMFIKELDTF